MRRFALTLPLALALLLGGCATFTLEPPADFLDLDEPEWSSYAYRATSADGVVLAVREVENEREGTLAFWTDAVRERLRSDRGYALLEETKVSAASGQEGVQLRFGHDEASQPYVYWVTLFPAEAGLFDPARLVIVEAGGKKEAFAALEERIAGAMRGIEIR